MISDPIFLPIPEHPNYEIDTTGIVRNVKTGQVRKPRILKSSVRWYLEYQLGRAHCRAHRLLVSAIEQRPLTSDELVCHRDGNTFNNSPDNLRIGTAKQNALDKIASNTNGHKLRNSQVREIRRLAATRTRKQIALLFDISTSYVGKIIRRKAWFNLP